MVLELRSTISASQIWTILAFSILIGVCVAFGILKNRGIKLRHGLFFVSFWGILSVVISRVYFSLVFSRHDQLFESGFFDVTKGKTSVWGWVLGLPTAGLIYFCLEKVFKKKSFAKELVGSSSAGLAVSQLFGRSTCLLNGCCFGKPTGVNFGVLYPPLSTAGITFGPHPLHPTQLYEMIGLLFCCLVVFYLFKRKYDSWFFAISYWLFYGISRAVSQFFRADFNCSSFSFASPVVHGLLLAFWGGACLIYRSLKSNRPNPPCSELADVAASGRGGWG